MPDNFSEIDVRELSLQAWRSSAVKSYRTGGGSRPDVLVVKAGEVDYVLKDFNACDRWFSLSLGKFLAKREVRIMRALDGIEGIPGFVVQPDPRSLVMEHAPGVPVSKAAHEIEMVSFFQDYQRLVDDIHSRGIAHCDLRSPGNTLVDEHSRAWAVDFVGGWQRRADPITGWMFKELALVDRSAIIKLKRAVAPDLLTAEDIDLEHSKHPLAGVARKLGESVRAITRKFLTRR